MTLRFKSRDGRPSFTWLRVYPRARITSSPVNASPPFFERPDIPNVVRIDMLFGEYCDVSTGCSSPHVFFSKATGGHLSSLVSQTRGSSEERRRRKPANGGFPSFFLFCFVNATLGHYSTLKRERVCWRPLLISCGRRRRKRKRPEPTCSPGRKACSVTLPVTRKERNMAERKRTAGSAPSFPGPVLRDMARDCCTVALRVTRVVLASGKTSTAMTLLLDVRSMAKTSRGRY